MKSGVSKIKAGVSKSLVNRFMCNKYTVNSYIYILKKSIKLIKLLKKKKVIFN